MADSSRLRFSGEEDLAFLEVAEVDGDIDVFCSGRNDELSLLEEGVEEEVDSDHQVEEVNDLKESRLAVKQHCRCFATEQAYLNYLHWLGSVRDHATRPAT